MHAILGMYHPARSRCIGTVPLSYCKRRTQKFAAPYVKDKQFSAGVGDVGTKSSQSLRIRPIMGGAARYVYVCTAGRTDSYFQLKGESCKCSIGLFQPARFGSVDAYARTHVKPFRREPPQTRASFCAQ